MNFEIDEKRQAAFDKLEKTSIEAVQLAIGRGGDLDDSEKAAMKALGVVAKNRQTMTNREALKFSMASMVGTPAELKKYIAFSSPDVKKALASGKK